MADEAENIRKQIRFLTGLIDNANRSKRVQENSKPVTKSSNRVVNTPGTVQNPCSGAARHLHVGENSYGNGDFASSKYCWKSTNLKTTTNVPVNVDTFGKEWLQNKMHRKASVTPKPVHKISDIPVSDRVSKLDSLNSRKLVNSKALACPSQTVQINSKSNNLRNIIKKSKVTEQHSVGNVYPCDAVKQDDTTTRTNIKNVSRITTKEELILQPPETVGAGGFNIPAGRTAGEKVDEKLKIFSSSLKDELKKTEEQINMLKQNLSEQKSLLKLKKHHTGCSGPVKQKLVDQTETLLGQSQINSSLGKQSIAEQNTSSPTVSHPKALNLITNATSQDNLFISKSPYKLVKANSSPVSSTACQEFKLGTHFQNELQTNQVKTKYKLEKVKPPVEMNVSGKKEIINNSKPSFENSAVTHPVYKKTTYTLRRIKSEPHSKFQNQKTPTKYVKLSKYSLRRVRRSLSNQSNEGSVAKCRFRTVNTNRSRRQSAARVIKGKYRINNNTIFGVVRQKQHFDQFNPLLHYPYGTKIWKSSLQPSRKNRKFYHYHHSRQWIPVTAPRYTGYSALPQKHYFKGSRYMPSAYFMSRRLTQPMNLSRRNRQRSLVELKKAVPFDPKLRTDHRQGKSKQEKLKLIDGEVYRSTGRKLIKASSSSTTSSVKHRYLNKSFRKISDTLVSHTQPRVLNHGQAQVAAGDAAVKPGINVQQSSWKTRVAAAQLMNRSIAMATAKYKKDNTKCTKKKKYCLFYNRFGKCNRKENCPFLHDSEKIAVCTRFLRGTCRVKDCPFSHKVSKEKMPVCSYFLRGKCTRDDCPYLHVNVNRDAEICEDFVSGYCSLGDKCKKKHTLVCPVFTQTGSCPNGKKCKLQHRKTRKRKLTQPLQSELLEKQSRPTTSSMGENSHIPSPSRVKVGHSPASEPSNLLKSWTSLVPKISGENPLVVLDSSDEDTDDTQVAFKDRKLPIYISLNVQNKDADTSTDPDSGTGKGGKNTGGSPAMKIRPQL